MSSSGSVVQSEAGDGDLDRRLFSAVERLGRALRAARQSLATRHHLSTLGASILETLADRRQRRVGDLAVELHISQPTASDALATLERQGHVVRRRDPADRRRTLTSLSPTGADIAADISAAFSPLLTTGADSAEARGPALRLLLTGITRLQAAGAISINRCCLTCHHYQPHNGSPARCLLLETTLHDTDLRVDCGEHQPTATVHDQRHTP
ncbi:MAG: MarR family winged helix-turn-helix transcriptional regulator [bacterium]|nr:MarR family winged helix-turn-helix transcriptional regulator [bacterium]